MECFFCKLPLTSDDFKQDKVEEAKSFIAHKTCVAKKFDIQRDIQRLYDELRGINNRTESDFGTLENFKTKN